MEGDAPGETPQARAVDVLQELGLKQYEAQCFVALTTLANGTARDISDIVEVPRTRVYEAIRVLEKEGLVEIQHSSPQRYRAIPIEEAVEILRDRYEARIESLEGALTDLGTEATPPDQGEHLDQEVWALSDTQAIRMRTQELIDDADARVVLILGSEEVLTEDLVGVLQDASDRGVTVTVGAVSPSLTDQLRSSLPDALVFESELHWLQGSDSDETDVGRFLLVDDTSILASSIFSHGEERVERAIYGSGFGNSLVVIARRLFATGMEANEI